MGQASPTDLREINLRDIDSISPTIQGDVLLYSPTLSRTDKSYVYGYIYHETFIKEYAELKREFLCKDDYLIFGVVHSVVKLFN
jgi:hypothetical protein